MGYTLNVYMSQSFSPVNFKSAREPQFFEYFHGQIFAFTGTLFRKLTGKWLRSRALFWTFSRAVFWHKWNKVPVNCRKVPVNAKIYHFVIKCSQALLRFSGSILMFTGTFVGSRTSFFFVSSRAQPKSSREICKNIHGHFFDVHGKKTLHVCMYIYIPFTSWLTLSRVNNPFSD